MAQKKYSRVTFEGGPLDGRVEKVALAEQTQHYAAREPRHAHRYARAIDLTVFEYCGIVRVNPARTVVRSLPPMKTDIVPDDLGEGAE